MEEILVIILSILLIGILVMVYFAKYKNKFYKPISIKILGRSIENYIKNYKSMGIYNLLAITSNTCSVCHTYLGQVREALKKEKLNLSITELQFDSKKSHDSADISHKIYYGDTKLRRKMKINQYPLYLLIDDKGLIKQIFITEQMALNYLKTNTNITELINGKTVTRLSN